MPDGFDAPKHSIALCNAVIADPAMGACVQADVLIDGGRIVEIDPQLGKIPDSVEQIDLRGMTVFPGLIDAHVHVTALRHNLWDSASLPPSYVYSGAGRVLRGMLSRGFTTVRDVGGADWGLAAAAADGTLGIVPRVVFCGKALSQTGGHGDMRPKGVSNEPCCSIGRVCDGPDAVRVAVRKQVSEGAGHIKLMLGGGVASELDGLEGIQFSNEEVEVAVLEASAAGIYVTAHAYTSETVRRAIKLGVRCIEHGNLIDEKVADELAKAGTFFVPTLITYEELADLVSRGEAPAYITSKLAGVRESGMRAVEFASRAGVRTVFGSDLLGSGHTRQLEEFAIRSEVQSPTELFHSATADAAALLGLDGDVGTVAVGASADLIIADLNPFETSLAELSGSRYAVMSRGRAGRHLNKILDR